MLASCCHLQELAIPLRTYKENFPDKRNLHPYERSLIELTFGEGNYEEVYFKTKVRWWSWHYQQNRFDFFPCSILDLSWKIIIWLFLFSCESLLPFFLPFLHLLHMRLYDLCFSLSWIDECACYQLHTMLRCSYLGSSLYSKQLLHVKNCLFLFMLQFYYYTSLCFTGVGTG